MQHWNTVQTIKYKAFWNCRSLKNIELPQSLTTVEYNAFYGSNFKSVTIPKSVTSIGDKAFGYEIGSRINDFVISGYQNTAAERYAAENEFTFIALDKPELIGDVNNDGKLDVADVTYLQMYLSGDSSYVIQNTKEADANGDGKIDVADVTQIQNIIASAA